MTPNQCIEKAAEIIWGDRKRPKGYSDVLMNMLDNCIHEIATGISDIEYERFGGLTAGRGLIVPEKYHQYLVDGIVAWYAAFLKLDNRDALPDESYIHSWEAGKQVIWGGMKNVTLFAPVEGAA